MGSSNFRCFGIVYGRFITEVKYFSGGGGLFEDDVTALVPAAPIRQQGPENPAVVAAP